MFLLNIDLIAFHTSIAVFTIQNVPIKSEENQDDIENEQNLQYKMFLLNN